MPTSLIKYTLNFFNAESIQQVMKMLGLKWANFSYLQDYCLTLFGMKSVKIRYGVRTQLPKNLLVTGISYQYKARVNIPALSDRTLRQGIAAGGYTLGLEIQVHICMMYMYTPVCMLLQNVIDSWIFMSLLYL